MTSERRQQRTLQAFARVGMPGVQAVAVDRFGEWFVIVDSETVAENIRSRRIVFCVDPAATRTHATSALHRDPDVPYAARAAAVSDVLPPFGLIAG